jgi:hypothetical protein
MSKQSKVTRALFPCGARELSWPRADCSFFDFVGDQKIILTGIANSCSAPSAFGKLSSFPETLPHQFPC